MYDFLSLGSFNNSVPILQVFSQVYCFIDVVFGHLLQFLYINHCHVLPFLTLKYQF